jgi:hypothetical protein
MAMLVTRVNGAVRVTGGTSTRNTSPGAVRHPAVSERSLGTCRMALVSLSPRFRMAIVSRFVVLYYLLNRRHTA